MELFSEIYSCYYQVVDRILRKAETHPATEKEMKQICDQYGFAESSLYILPKLINGEWKLLIPDGSCFRAVTIGHGSPPFTRLQRSWLKTLLQDSRFRLFFTEEELVVLQKYTEDADLLWRPEDLHYYDRYADGDPYDSARYRSHFQTLVRALSKKQYVNISYQSEKGNRTTHHYLPLKLEYSDKNDRFRLLAVPEKEKRSAMIRTLNLRGITMTALLPRFCGEDLDFEQIIQRSYYREPVRLLIKNQRNTLERAMLHFSNYEKKTKKTDEDTWECLIYYNRSMETELLIEILSFGPTLQVTGPESFLRLMQERLKRQTELFLQAGPDERPTDSPS